jgi:hypothetical protein
MCDPTGGLATAALIASTVTAAGGAIYAGVRQNQAAKYQAAVDQQNAILAMRQANDARERGAREELNHYRRLSQLRGQQVAAMAANGIDVSFGSALDTQVDTAILGAEDAQTLRENTINEIQGYEINAENYRSRAAAARAAGQTALVSGAIGAGSTLLGGASQLAGMSSKYGASGLTKAASKLSVKNPALDIGFANTKIATLSPY